MYIIKDLLSIKLIKEYKYQFEKENYELLLSRIRILCLAFVILSFYFFYTDIIIYKNLNNITFKTTLILIHIVGFIISVLFLLFYKCIKNNFNIKLIKFTIQSSIITLLIIGSLLSINSQRLTGNIDSYIIFTIIAAIVFPFEPKFMFISFLINHILLIVGITSLSKDHYSLITKQMNSTSIVMLSFLFCYSLYKFNILNFINRYTLAKSESNFKQIFSVNPIPLFISRYEDGKIIMANDRAYDFYGYTKDEFYKISANNLYKDEEDRSAILNKLHDNYKIQNYIVEQKNKLGKTKWVITNCELIEYYDEKCILTCVTDITQIKKIENELLDKASTDTLTGILNRRSGIELLKNQVNINKHNHSLSVVCFIDIDGLKHVNDNYGHNEGDFLIVQITSIIKKYIDSTDIFFRYGGDEFVVLFSDKNEHLVENIWNKIQSEFNRVNNENLNPYKLSASHGLFKYNGDIDLTIEKILDLADKKMYCEKNNKKSLKNNVFY